VGRNERISESRRKDNPFFGPLLFGGGALACCAAARHALFTPTRPLTPDLWVQSCSYGLGLPLLHMPAVGIPHRRGDRQRRGDSGYHVTMCLEDARVGGRWRREQALPVAESPGGVIERDSGVGDRARTGKIKRPMVAAIADQKR
jgi:hypothetical protein